MREVENKLQESMEDERRINNRTRARIGKRRNRRWKAYKR